MEPPEETRMESPTVREILSAITRATPGQYLSFERLNQAIGPLTAESIAAAARLLAMLPASVESLLVRTENDPGAREWFMVLAMRAEPAEE